MKKYDMVNGVPVMSWCPNTEEGAARQIVDAAKHPAAFNHVALMSDAHQGYGVPIGAVVALKDAISPNMVGVDIGCGMRAVKTSIRDFNEDFLCVMHEKIKRLIPVGFAKRNNRIDHNFDINGAFKFLSKHNDKFSNNYKKDVEKSMGTLGGGNHFIELQKGDDGYLWIMIHSGSRNFGKTIADIWNDIAVAKNKAYKTDRNDIAPDLSFLPFGVDGDAENYLKAMSFALDYAKENRRIMMQAIKDCMFEQNDYGCLFELDIHHNYAALENHFGHNVWVHRKGATSAKAGQLGIIPGSMGTKSYIVEGLGNPMSFNSCSHGAGRVKGRNAATMSLDLKSEQEIMKDVVYDGFQIIKRGSKKLRGMHDLGEAPGAYKDIDEVMKNQSDLVQIHTELIPLMVVKG